MALDAEVHLVVGVSGTDLDIGMFRLHLVHSPVLGVGLKMTKSIGNSAVDKLQKANS